MKFIIPIFLIFFSFSCTPVDKLINEPDNTFYLLLLNEATPTTFSLVKMPQAEIISEDIFYQINSIKFSSKPYSIVEQPLDLYILFPEEFRILIFQKSNLKYKAEIDFSEIEKEPISICFPNSTDAYVVFRNCDTIALVDLTNHKIARWIYSGKSPVAIASLGNKCFVLNSLDNSVSIIRTNTHNKEAEVQLYDRPHFLGFTSDGKNAIIVCLGAGKLDPNQTRTEAKVFSVDASTYRIISSINIETTIANAIQQFPLSFTISANDYAFIGTEQNLIRFDARKSDRLYSVYSGYFYNLIYNYWNNELLMLQQKNEESWIVIADPKTGKKIYEIKYPQKIQMIFPIKFEH